METPKFKEITTKKGTRKVEMCQCPACGGEHFKHKQPTKTIEAAIESIPE